MGKVLTRKFGPWAIVTGASSGIGEEFARQLAQQGLNLVLCARSKTKLERVAKEIHQQFGVSVRAVQLDLVQPDFLDFLKAEVADLDVGLLVSNAGAAHMGALLKNEPAVLTNMVRLNVLAHLELSHYFLNGLVQNKRPGGLLLVASTAGLQGVPYGANYSAAKSYVINLGEALNYEFQSHPIHVSVTAPGPTSTPAFHDRKDVDLTVMPLPPMPVEQCVRGALKALRRNQPLYIPGMLNKLMAGLMGRKLLPRQASVAMWGTLMKRATPQELML